MKEHPVIRHIKTLNLHYISQKPDFEEKNYDHECTEWLNQMHHNETNFFLTLATNKNQFNQDL